MTVSMPVFPLNAVLFPGGVLPLRVFETRYLDMVRERMRVDEPFLVCLIISGSESGEARFHDIGCTASVFDWHTGDDGLLHLDCIGERRARVHAGSVMDDGLNVAEVELLAAPEPVALDARHADLGRLLTRVFEEVEPPLAGPQRLEDADWVANRLCELLPMSLSQRQRFLQIEDAHERLDLVAQLLPTLRA